MVLISVPARVVQLTPDLEIEGYSADDVIANLLTAVEAPRA